MFPNSFQDFRYQRQAGHGFQGQILGVGILSGEEPSQHAHTFLQQILSDLVVEAKHDSLQQNGVLGVVATLLNLLLAFQGLLDGSWWSIKLTINKIKSKKR